MRRTLGLLAAATALMIVSASCGTTTPKKAAAPTPVHDVSVSLKEYSITPSVVSVAAGPFTVVAKNEGTMIHELVFLKTDVAYNALPVKDQKAPEEAAGIESPGEISEFAAGKTITKTFDFAPGHYVMLCNIEGHYASGMRVAFDVTA